MPRYFSTQEANAMLDVIRPMVGEIIQIHQRVVERQPEAWPAIERAAGNGGNRAASELVLEFEKLRGLVQALKEQGVIVKDMSSGLLDFPSMRDGREVYLCWKYGEDQVAFWHDVDAGFAGRQPL